MSGSAVADSGLLTTGSLFTALHASASTVWSNPAGNGSIKSISSNNWSEGDYYQFSFSTIGYGLLSITWDQTGSATGPRDFKVQYSTNGSTFTDATGKNGTDTLTNDSWSSSGPPKSVSTRTLDLSGVADVNNQSTVYIRLVDNSTVAVNGTTVATTGTGRVDNFIVNAVSEVPVEMTSFTATAQQANALLAWSTATEVNNFGFNIERRAIASSAWAKVGFVAGNGTSNATHNYTYADNNLSAGTYAYRIKQIDNDGTFKYSASTEVTVAGVPKELKLYGNYPNPFNPSTKVQFTVPENGNARLSVYNILGQEVATLFSGAAEAGNLYTANFNASRMASGLYFSVLEFGSQRITHKMLMTK